MNKLFGILSLIACLSAVSCGGGGGMSTPPVTNPPPVENPTPTTPTTPSDPAPPANDIPIEGLPVAGRIMSDDSSLFAATVVGQGFSMSTVDIQHDSLDQALQINVTAPQGEYWSSQILVPTVGDVSEGDVLLVRVLFRTIATQYESGNGFVTLFMEGPAPDYTKFIAREVTSDQAWVEYLLPFVVGQDFDEGTFPLRIGVGAGDRPQTVELAGLYVLNFEQNTTLEALPKTVLSYGGRALDANWRRAAEARIEQHRKGDFNVAVVGPQGTPINNAQISMAFKKHAYHFGTVIDAGRLLGDDTDSQTYRDTLQQYFNQSGTENDLKWAPWIGEWGDGYNQEQTIDALTWLKEQDFYVRGHVLVWPSKRNMPTFLDSLLGTTPSMANAGVLDLVDEHIQDITSATLPWVDEWDVLNEPYDNHYLMDAFGDDIMPQWFAQARDNLPEQGLYINDYSILSAGGRNAAHQQHYQDTIQYLVDNNAPITGIGLQSHFGPAPTDIETVFELVDRYHKAFPSLAIRATEFDINTADEALQGDYTRDFLTIMFSHPATVGVQTWGFWENQIWIADAAMFDSEWRAKPNADAWLSLVKNQWWNDFDGVTDANGNFAQRGFYGDYVLTVTVDGATFEVPISVTPQSDNQFVVAVD